jgi:hypothetical protein
VEKASEVFSEKPHFKAQNSVARQIAGENRRKPRSEKAVFSKSQKAKGQELMKNIYRKTPSLSIYTSRRVCARTREGISVFYFGPVHIYVA